MGALHTLRDQMKAVIGETIYDWGLVAIAAAVVVVWAFALGTVARKLDTTTATVTATVIN